MKKLLAIGLAVLVQFAGALPARAEADARTFLQRIDAGEQIFLYVLDGYANGFGWANSELKERGQAPLFCPPEDLAITAEQTADILRRFVRERPQAGNAPAGLALLMALQNVFPCPATR